ncbi:unnamed protein product [Owenia fusiformis]|uniref:Uncharacterized protein n=1 Tax=Owenia fusiformis TaxID=6347 RepID=A0A8J1TDK4_OWEFU|nr:unnamed protein product [Owenia fusiformis]
MSDDAASVEPDGNLEIIYQQDHYDNGTLIQHKYKAAQLVTSTHARKSYGLQGDCQTSDGAPATVNKTFDETKSVEQWQQSDAEEKRIEFMDTLQKKGSMKIQMIGLPGVGKTSFLNTLAAAICGHFDESFEVTKVEEFDLHIIFNAGNNPSVKRLIKEKPFSSGLTGQEGGMYSKRRFKKVIRSLIFGPVKDGENIIGPDGLLSMETMEIRKTFSSAESEEETQPDVVFRIISADSPLPDAMLNDVRQTLRYKQNVRVCGVITKIDTVTDCDVYRLKKEKFIDILNLKREEHTLLELKNYVGVRPGERRPSIDMNVLNILLRLLKELPDKETMKGLDQLDQEFEGDVTDILGYSEEWIDSLCYLAKVFVSSIAIGAGILLYVMCRIGMF